MINIKISDHKITKVIITDIRGKIIMDKRLLDSNEIVQLSLSHLSDGIYIITLFNNSKVIKKEKIIVLNK